LQNIQPIPDTRNYPPEEPNGTADPAKQNEADNRSQKPIPLTDPTPPLTPVPDLDAASGRKQVPAAPSLFDPRDRTASYGIRRAWAISPIVWPDGSQPVEARTVTAAMSAEPEKETDNLDADGWQAVRP
jgi:hypothetical protein